MKSPIEKEQGQDSRAGRSSSLPVSIRHSMTSASPAQPHRSTMMPSKAKEPAKPAGLPVRDPLPFKIQGRASHK